MPVDPRNIRVGPGWLYIAPLGSTEPTDLATAWDAAWTRIGYTEEGHTFTYELSVEGIEVAESLDVIRYETTGRESTVAFAMAEVTARNMQIAINGGDITPGGSGANSYATFEPPPIGEEVRTMLGWEANDGKERFVWRQCLSSGGVEMNRSKAPDKTTLPVEFRVEVPVNQTTGAASLPWKYIIAQPAA